MEQLATGEKIKVLRLRLGFSQEDLAEGAGLSLRSIQRIENGETVPRGDSLKRIATALHVDIAELTSSTEANAPDPVTLPKEDPKVSLILILSAFGYLLNPILAVIFPAVIWMLYKNTSRSVHDIGWKLIRIELVWCTIILLLYAYIFGNKFFHAGLPTPNNGKVGVLSIFAAYVVNFCIIAGILFSFLRENKTLQKA
ncbi:MAG: helix-turn-helix domain-containing protein [Williamsia sp.]|nr:helix-turn-helix domain-containing protein [Williamsia sp.]